MKISPWLLPLTSLFSAAFMAAFVCAGFLLVTLNATLPDAKSIREVELKVPLRVYSSEGLLISEFGNERRKRVSFDDTPKLLIDAILASEDDNFYNHRGIDFFGLVRAALSNFRSGETQQGASTITMQVARNFFLTREKTYERKLKEVLLAFRLEQILSKNEILELYLNKIFLGHRAYGFGAAADVYYDKGLDELSVAEYAMMAGLPKAPSRNNPISNPKRAEARRNYVLRRLFDLEKIDETTFKLAKYAPITAKRHGSNVELAAPHIAEMVRAQLIEEFGEDTYWAGLNVVTTIKAAPQIAAQKALRHGLQSYDTRHGFRGPVAQVEIDNLIAEDIDLSIRDENIDSYLAEFPSSQEQHPAIVLASEELSATVYVKNIGEVSLSLETSMWARRHITANKLGDRPTSMTEIVTPGDIIYVKILPVQKSAEENITAEGSEDPDASEQAEQAEQQWQLSQIPNISGAIISIEPSTGRILSLVGGYDFFINKYNRAVQSIRQPGSNIKPFIYSASLDKGFTPASLISGAPIVITDPLHGTVWRPENYSGSFFGPTRMREALAKSLNLVSIRLLRAIGIHDTKEYLDRFGIDTNRFASSLTMALGSGGVTPLELLAAYGALANGGYQVKPYFIDHITDRDGNVVYKSEPPTFCDECYQDYLPKTEEQLELEAATELLSLESEQVPIEVSDAGENPAEQALQSTQAEENLNNETDAALEEGPIISTYQAPRIMNSANNFLTTSMLKGVIENGTARKARALERVDLAGKTGTTNDYVDAWFTGYNSQIATTVWIGFDEPTTMGRGEAGSVAALPIWIDYMKVALADIPQDPEFVPEYMMEGLVNRETGTPTDELDPDAITEYFPIAELLPEPMGDIGIRTPLLTESVDEEHMDDVVPDQYPSNEDFFENELEEIEPPKQQNKIIEDEETEGLF